MTIQKKILLAVILGFALYGGIYIYALNSDAFRFVKTSLENSRGLAQRVGAGATVTLPLFGAFKERYVNSSETVIMVVAVAGSNGSVLVNVKAVRTDGLWKIESASAEGSPIDLNQ